ncbi:MAG TPA: tRNA (adenosine(37)-N6)-threonylcarbamoyltransferase complex dimerization subunit type 1 TsaB [Terriglobia bacterium]|nr:tRNA (adenosine(37)-N6)-threonylcarbamoyltransferase complex dimerization subunit type 1 TsaB [Terriglobia bacterium]
MIILSFDTTSASGGAALSRDGVTLGELEAGGSANYSVELFEITHRLLAAASLRLADVELFAVATGPGSFTGIRVGLAAAQGWAHALGRPVRGVSVFEAMLARADPSADVAVPLLDARRGEFYLGVFRERAQASAGPAGATRWTQQGDGLVLDPPRIAAVADGLRSESGRGPAFVFRAHDNAARDLCQRLDAARGLSAQKIGVPGFLAGAIARVAWQAAGEGRLQRPEELDAYYIRRSDAELNWRE